MGQTTNFTPPTVFPTISYVMLGGHMEKKSSERGFQMIEKATMNVFNSIWFTFCKWTRMLSWRKGRAGGGTPKHITEVLFPLYIFVQEIQALGKEKVYITAIKRVKEKEIYIIATKWLNLLQIYQERPSNQVNSADEPNNSYQCIIQMMPIQHTASLYCIKLYLDLRDINSFPPFCWGVGVILQSHEPYCTLGSSYQLQSK